jgi:hypothetical protein
MEFNSSFKPKQHSPVAALTADKNWHSFAASDLRRSGESLTGRACLAGGSEVFHHN